MKPNIRMALLWIMLICFVKERSLERVIPRFLLIQTIFHDCCKRTNGDPSRVSDNITIVKQWGVGLRTRGEVCDLCELWWFSRNSHSPLVGYAPKIENAVSLFSIPNDEAQLPPWWSVVHGRASRNGDGVDARTSRFPRQIYIDLNRPIETRDTTSGSNGIRTTRFDRSIARATDVRLITCETRESNFNMI